MIRKHSPEDLDQIIDIWSQASALAHPFLNANFVEKVRHDMTHLYIPGSDTWVYETDEGIVGFISMIGNEIGGLFVRPNSHSKGIGSTLVNFIKEQHDTLEVEVFENNSIGRAFYAKYGFKQIKQYHHEQSGHEVLRLQLIP